MLFMPCAATRVVVTRTARKLQPLKRSLAQSPLQLWHLMLVGSGALRRHGAAVHVETLTLGYAVSQQGCWAWERMLAYRCCTAACCNDGIVGAQGSLLQHATAAACAVI